MTYKDILSDAISHFTDIPKEFVLGYLKRFVDTNGENGELLNYLLQIEFPEIEGAILLNDLKSRDLQSTISFFSNSFNVLREEESRAAMVN